MTGANLTRDIRGLDASRLEPLGTAEMEPASSNTSTGRSLLAILVLALLCGLCAPLFVDRIDEGAPKARHGAVSFACWSALDRPVPLAGQWNMTWRGPAVARGPAVGERLPIRVPGEWTGLSGAPEQGFATYQLTVKGVRPGSYILFVPTIFAASRVWLNDRMVSQMGQVALTAAQNRYLWRAQEIPFVSDGSDLRLSIDIAAFHHRSNGMDGAPVLGLAPAMQAWLVSEWVKDLLFISTLALLTVFGLVIFIFRSDDYASLYFAIACLLFMTPALILGHDNVLAVVLPGLGFVPMLWSMYLCAVSSVLFFLAYANSLFPNESPPLVYRGLQGLLLFSIGLVVAALSMGNTVLASHLFSYGGGLDSLTLVYILAVVSVAVLRRRDGAVMFLLGFGVFAGTMLIYEIIENNLMAQDQLAGVDLLPIGILVLLFSHVIILAERWSIAIRAAEAMAVDLRRLMDVSASITTEVHLESLLRNIVEATSKFLHADRSSLFLYDPRAGELRTIVAEGVQTREIRVDAGAGIAGDSFARGEVVIVDDAYRDPRFNQAVDELTGYVTRTMLTMPIVTRDGRRLGVMQALNRRDRRGFGAADIARMRAFAAHAAVAIDNATLFSEIVAARNYNESILGSMAGGVITLDAEGRVEKLNAAAARILEIEPDPILGLAAADVLSGDNAWVLAELDGVRADNSARTLLDVDVLTAAGRTISVNLSIVPLVAEATSVGLLILIEDISQEKRLEGAMRRFMTQRVVDQVLQRQDDLLFGSACTASVLFADIRNFTSMAESLKPRETVDMLNEVFTELVEAVSASDGVLDKFIGDAVMAVYGAPLSSGRDPENAVESAIAMMRMLAALNLRRAERGQFPLRLGIGISTGELIAGTIGSPKRMDYTVIGDSVNLASRLQGVTKHYGVGIVVCEATAQANAKTQILRELDTIGVRGRNRPEKIYQVLSYHTEDSFPHMHRVLAAYTDGMARQQAQDWSGAAEAFAFALHLNPADRPSELMLERARAAMRAPAGEEFGQTWAEAGPA